MSKNIVTYPIIIHPEKDNYQVKIPDFESSSWSPVDSLENCIEIAQKMITNKLFDQTAYPIPTPLAQINVDNDDVKTIVSVDLDQNNLILDSVNDDQKTSDDDGAALIYIVLIDNHIDSIYANLKDALAKIGSQVIDETDDDAKNRSDYQLDIKPISHLNVDLHKNND